MRNSFAFIAFVLVDSSILLLETRGVGVIPLISLFVVPLMLGTFGYPAFTGPNKGRLPCAVPLVSAAIAWLANLGLSYFSNRSGLSWTAPLVFAIWQCSVTAIFVPIGRALYKLEARTTTDGSAKLVKVGDLVRVVSIPQGGSRSLIPADVAALTSMVGETFEIREIDESGTAWVWREMHSGRRGVGLSPEKMRLVYPVHRRPSTESPI
jgi:hypothetical protein